MDNNKYFKMTKDFTEKYDQYSKQEQAIMYARRDWIKQEFGLEFDEFYQFTETPMFTNEQLDAIPELKNYCTKSSDHTRLSRTNQKAKRLITSWKTFLKEHGLDQYLKKNRPDPATKQMFLARTAFPNGRISFTRDKNNQIVCSTSCSKENVNMTHIEAELTRKDYLEIDLAYEKRLEKDA